MNSIPEISDRNIHVYVDKTTHVIGPNNSRHTLLFHLQYTLDKAHMFALDQIDPMMIGMRMGMEVDPDKFWWLVGMTIREMKFMME